jgi:CheY-like chemotaxis protein/anti-sigma regulatory factor (Ser/Thr protein kinase)
VLGDPLRLRQVVANLTSNAVKFTSRGQVSLHVQTRPEGEGADEAISVKIIVRDTGPGFDDVTRARLFTRFEQGDGSVTRRFGGTGLGLAIASQLAELMQGSVDCTSAPGRGSVFVFVARLKRAPAFQAPAPEDRVALNALPPRLRILLAEDHPTNQKVVELLLGDQVELTIEADGRAALDTFTRGSFDLVLMDTQMPVMDGLAAIREIRRAEARDDRPRTPIISLTANAMPHQVGDCLAAGADLHLPKPITAEALFRAIDMVLPPPPAALAALVATG